MHRTPPSRLAEGDVSPTAFQSTASLLKKGLKPLEKTPSGRSAGPKGGKAVHTPPPEVRAAAKKGLAMRKQRESMGKSRLGGTDIGVARAKQLMSGDPIPPRSIKRMKAYFDRHVNDKKADNWDEPSPGKVAWYLWGGDAGYAWAKREVASLEEQDNPLAQLSDQDLDALLGLSDEELAAEGLTRDALQAEKDSRQGGGAQQAPQAPQAAAPAATDDPVANEPEDDEAPEPDDPVVLTVEVIERDGTDDGGNVVKTFEFAGATKEAALDELKVAARRNKLLRAAMNEVPYKGRNFYLKQSFLDKDPDVPEAAEESVIWQQVVLAEGAYE